jgi:hypothetical protein
MSFVNDIPETEANRSRNPSRGCRALNAHGANMRAQGGSTGMVWFAAGRVEVYLSQRARMVLDRWERPEKSKVAVG